MNEIKRYMQLFENVENDKLDYETNEYDNPEDAYKVDKKFSVKQNEDMYHIVGDQTGFVYGSYDEESKDKAELRKDSMNQKRTQELDDINEDVEYLDDEEPELDMGEEEPELDMGEEEPDFVGMGDEIDSELDSELDSEISMADSEDEFSYEDDYGLEEPVTGEEETVDSENDELLFNYTATIQLHGYDYPLVLHSDSIDEFKTIMKVFKQSGLNPDGEYKWNSRRFDLESEMEEGLTESSHEQNTYSDSKEWKKKVKSLGKDVKIKEKRGSQDTYEARDKDGKYVGEWRGDKGFISQDFD